MLASFTIGLDWFRYHALWVPPLARLIFAVDWLVLGSLARSYLLASLLATPGCEWQALPDLIAHLKGKLLQDPHSCPMGLDRLDHWEAHRTMVNIRASHMVWGQLPTSVTNRCLK